MRNFRNITILAALAAMTVPASAAHTNKLTVVTVDPGAVVCVFSPKCSVAPKDTMGTLPKSVSFTGPVRLQSRTYAGQRGSKGAGNTAYIYRLDFTHAVRGKNLHCADGVDIDFGPVTKLPYGPKGAMADVFVINSGGRNFVGVKSADERKGKVSIEFASPVCPSNGAYRGQSSFFFGLASPKPPKAGDVTVNLTFGARDEKVPARIPAQ